MRFALARFKFLIGVFSGSMLLVLWGFLWAFFALRDVAQVLIIHFTADVGINQTGTFWHLGVIAILSASVVCLNFLIALELELRERLLGKVVTYFTLFFSILIFTYFRLIISVNYL